MLLNRRHVSGSMTRSRILSPIGGMRPPRPVRKAARRAYAEFQAAVAAASLEFARAAGPTGFYLYTSSTRPCKRTRLSPCSTRICQYRAAVRGVLTLHSSQPRIRAFGYLLDRGNRASRKCNILNLDNYGNRDINK